MGRKFNLVIAAAVLMAAPAAAQAVTYDHAAPAAAPVAAPAKKKPTTDQGPNPYVFNIEKATRANKNFRTAAWTGTYLQLTLMSVPVNGDIGVEMHPDVDQFIRVEKGKGLVQMGKVKGKWTYTKMAKSGDAILIPAGWWHNVTVKGNKPLKVYSLYGPPNHPHGTVHVTKPDEDH